MKITNNANRDGDTLLRRDLIGRSTGAFVAGSALVAMAAMPVGEARGQAAAQSSKLQEILRRGNLIVGTGSTNPPWHFEDENGQLVGMDIDMARLFAKVSSTIPAKSNSCASRRMRASRTWSPTRSTLSASS